MGKAKREKAIEKKKDKLRRDADKKLQSLPVFICGSCFQVPGDQEERLLNNILATQQTRLFYEWWPVKPLALKILEYLNILTFHSTSQENLTKLLMVYRKWIHMVCDSKLSLKTWIHWLNQNILYPRTLEFLDVYLKPKLPDDLHTIVFEYVGRNWLRTFDVNERYLSLLFKMFRFAAQTNYRQFEELFHHVLNPKVPKPSPFVRGTIQNFLNNPSYFDKITYCWPCYSYHFTSNKTIKEWEKEVKSNNREWSEALWN